MEIHKAQGLAALTEYIASPVEFTAMFCPLDITQPGSQVLI
jgi:hypothetical protein